MTPTALGGFGHDMESWLGPHGKRGELDRVLLGEIAMHRDSGRFSKLRIYYVKL